MGYAWAALAPRRFHTILGATDILAAGYEAFLTHQQLGEDAWRLVPSKIRRKSEDDPDADLGSALARGEVHTEPCQDRDLIVGRQRLPLR